MTRPDSPEAQPIGGLLIGAVVATILWGLIWLVAEVML